jgi:hypothetical protein
VAAIIPDETGLPSNTRLTRSNYVLIQYLELLVTSSFGTQQSSAVHFRSVKLTDNSTLPFLLYKACTIQTPQDFRIFRAAGQTEKEGIKKAMLLYFFIYRKAS